MNPSPDRHRTASVRVALEELRLRSTCPACAGPAPALCSHCALVRPISDDLEMWDAWSLLGDVGTALSER